MKLSLQAYLFQVLVACMVMAGCASAEQGTPTDIQSSIEAELGKVEKVTVMSTDGQEVALDSNVFMKELPELGGSWQISDNPLKQEEVRYTLVLYRNQSAPFVVSVGETGSQYGDTTYRGNDVSRFYRWIYRLTGEGLLARDVAGVQLSAVDLASSKTLDKHEIAEVTELLAKAVPQPDAGRGVKQYPLHPYYQMRVHTDKNPLEITVLTPTLVSVPFGRETLYYQVEGELFSKLTVWQPPREKAEDPFEKLYKASKLRVESPGSPNVQSMEYDVTQTTVEQGIAHQIVRTLRTAEPLAEPPAQPGTRLFVLHFSGNGLDRSVTFYSRYMQVEDHWFQHKSLDESIEQMLKSLRLQKGS